MLNQNRGFVIIQKLPPPLALYCDRRKYSMLKLTASSKERTPDNPIYNHGANIIPISCKKYHDSNDITNSSEGDTANHKTSQSISKLTVATSLDDEIPVPIIKFAPQVLPPGPSEILPTMDPINDYKEQEEMDPSGEEVKRYFT